MKAKLTLLSPLLAAVVLAVVGLTACSSSKDSTTHAHQYTCSMHPEVVQDKPGDCPKCNMKLVEKH